MPSLLRTPISNISSYLDQSDQTQKIFWVTPETNENREKDFFTFYANYFISEKSNQRLKPWKPDIIFVYEKTKSPFQRCKKPPKFSNKWSWGSTSKLRTFFVVYPIRLYESLHTYMRSLFNAWVCAATFMCMHGYSVPSGHTAAQYQCTTTTKEGRRTRSRGRGQPSRTSNRIEDSNFRIAGAVAAAITECVSEWVSSSSRSSGFEQRKSIKLEAFEGRQAKAERRGRTTV